MIQIDYEAEVKKKYPDAFCEYVFSTDFGILWYVEKDGESLSPMGEYRKTKPLAWQSAYNNINQTKQ